jgi:hypothetical protein
LPRLSAAGEPAHFWQPIPKWRARYRCAFCGVLGYRKDVTTNPDTGLKLRQPGIVPYRCTAPGCVKGAIVRKPRQLCAIHKADDK